MAKKTAKKKTAKGKNGNSAPNLSASVPTPSSALPLQPEVQRTNIYPVPENLWAAILKTIGSLPYNEVAGLVPMMAGIQPVSVGVTPKPHSTGQLS